jgi:hypothetical protein
VTEVVRLDDLASPETVTQAAQLIAIEVIKKPVHEVR